MTARPWGDHQEHRLTLTRITGCDGAPLYEGGTDQRSFCADGCISFNDGDFHLPVAKLAEFTATLYETAGKPEPVILERPRPRDLLVPGAGDGESWVDVTPSRIRDGGVTLTLRVWNDGSGGYGSVRLVGDEPLRVAVALADAMRDMQDEPDPAEVEELAALMGAEMDRRANGQSGLYPAVARIALQWMNGRQQRGGQP